MPPSVYALLGEVPPELEPPLLLVLPPLLLALPVPPLLAPPPLPDPP